MAVQVERLIRVVISRHDRPADKCLQRQGREHVQTEATAGISTRGIDVEQWSITVVLC